jgi:hypothetical protein
LLLGKQLELNNNRKTFQVWKFFWWSKIRKCFDLKFSFPLQETIWLGYNNKIIQLRQVVYSLHISACISLCLFVYVSLLLCFVSFSITSNVLSVHVIIRHLWNVQFLRPLCLTETLGKKICQFFFVISTGYKTKQKHFSTHFFSNGLVLGKWDDKLFINYF